MIHIFKHHAMATEFQVRLATDDATYAAQAARAAFDEADRLENLLSRFREHSDISAIARLAPGESARLSEPTCACLTIAQEMERATAGAFSVTPLGRSSQGAETMKGLVAPGQNELAAPSSQPSPPVGEKAGMRGKPGLHSIGSNLLYRANAFPTWSLDLKTFSIRCEAGRLEFDLGAIGKGFALDRMAEVLAEWDCPAFLLIAGGSSILAGGPPPDRPGWSVGLGDDPAAPAHWLTHCSLSGSGVAVQGKHIFDPRTGRVADKRPRAWAFAPTGAVSDALSTACMVLAESEIAQITAGRNDWLVWLNENGVGRSHGGWPMPARV